MAETLREKLDAKKCIGEVQSTKTREYLDGWNEAIDDMIAIVGEHERSAAVASQERPARAALRDEIEWGSGHEAKALARYTYALVEALDANTRAIRETRGGAQNG